MWPSCARSHEVGDGMRTGSVVGLTHTCVSAGRLGLVLTITFGVFAVAGTAARADETVLACNGPNHIFSPQGTPGISVYDNCEEGGGLDIDAAVPTSQGTASSWHADAPPGLT